MFKKVCLPPAPIFWSKLDERPGAAEKLCADMGEANDEPGRAQAYARFRETLRKAGMLCENPDHQPAEFKIQ